MFWSQGELLTKCNESFKLLLLWKIHPYAFFNQSRNKYLELFHPVVVVWFPLASEWDWRWNSQFLQFGFSWRNYGFILGLFIFLSHSFVAMVTFHIPQLPLHLADGWSCFFSMADAHRKPCCFPFFICCRLETRWQQIDLASHRRRCESSWFRPQSISLVAAGVGCFVFGFGFFFQTVALYTRTFLSSYH